MYPILAENNQIVGCTTTIPPMYVGSEIPENFSIRDDEETAAFYENGQFIRKNVFDIDAYRYKKLKYISTLCYQEMNKLLSPSKQINILLGATSGYPEYLQGDTGKANVAKMIETYKIIYHSVEKAINSVECDSKIKIDSILSKVVLPSEKEIISAILDKD